MKRGLCYLALLLALLPAGCMDRMDIENISLALIIGLDLDDNNNLEVSISSPVFSREAKRKTEVYTAKSLTMRASQDEFDKTFKAFTSGGKSQILLVGKKLMMQKHWFALLDPLLRDPKNSTTARIVLVDGPVSEVIHYNPLDKPRLPIYLTYLIDTASHLNLATRTTLQELHSINLDKGITASIAELRFDDKIFIKGSALLSENGIYKLSIGDEETRLLRMLQGEKNGEFKFTLEHEGAAPGNGIVPRNLYTISAVKYSRRLKTGYAQDHFTFDFHFHIRVSLLEKLFPFDVLKSGDVLEAEIARKLEDKFRSLIQKFQQAKIDPIGLGRFARAYRYNEWKPVENKWSATLSDADINVKVGVLIAAMGSIR